MGQNNTQYFSLRGAFSQMSLKLKCLKSRESKNHGVRDSKLLANRVAQFETDLKSKKIGKPQQGFELPKNLFGLFLTFNVKNNPKRFVGKFRESLQKYRGNLWKMFCNHPYPKDPTVLKILRDSELLCPSVLLRPPIFTML